jgi:hypothetical protein
MLADIEPGFLALFAQANYANALQESRPTTIRAATAAFHDLLAKWP